MSPSMGAGRASTAHAGWVMQGSQFRVRHGWRGAWSPREAGCCACRSASPYNLGVEWVLTRAYVEAATAHKPAW